MSDSAPSGRSEKEIFFEALDKPTAQERAAFLDGACGANRVQRARVEALLADHFRVWKLPGLERLPSLRLNRESNGSTAFSPPGSLAFSADGKFVVAGLLDGQIAVWDFPTRKVVATRKEHTGWVTAVAVAPDGKTFATASSDRTVNLWDAVTIKHLVRLRGHVGEVWSLAFAPDGHTVMSGSADGTTKLWRADARHDQMLEGPNVLLGFIGDGRSLIAAATSQLVSVWTPESGARVDFPIPTNPPISSVTLPPFHVKPNEPLGALGRSDGTVELWHLETGAKETTWPAHKETIGVVAFSPDGKALATASLDNDARVWEVPSGKLRTTLRGHVQGVIAVEFSPDGKSIATGSHEGKVKLWDVATHQELATFTLGGLFPTLGFSPDGRMLAVGNAFEARIQILRAPSFEEIAAAETKPRDAVNP